MHDLMDERMAMYKPRGKAAAAVAAAQAAAAAAAANTIDPQVGTRHGHLVRSWFPCLYLLFQLRCKRMHGLVQLCTACH